MNAALLDLVHRTVLCLGIATAVYGATATIDTPAPAAPAPSPVEFGVLDEHGHFVETDVVPLAIGQEFGWRLHVDDAAEHTWREILIAPAAPREWIGDDLLVAADGTSGVTERTELPRGGTLSHGWAITEGDPAGPYVIHLFVDGELVQSMHFVVR